MILELVSDLCAACSDGAGLGGSDFVGTAGAPSSGPPPGGSGSKGGSGGSGGDGGPGGSGGSGGTGGDGGSGGDGGDGPSGDPPPDDSWWDGLFDSDPAAEAAAETVLQDISTGIALDAAGTRLPWATGAAGAAGTLVSGSEVLAEGLTVIIENDGRGMGGSSKSGNSAWEAIERERATHNPPPEDD